MAKVHYSDKQVEEFVAEAQEMGVGPAMRSLGYPSSWATAQRWFAEKGIELPTVDSLQEKARALRTTYGDKEKMVVAQTELDRIVEKLHKDDLSADDLKKLADAMHKTVVTINLIEGKATSVHEQRQKDGTDLAIMDMLNEAKARNAIIDEEIHSD
jgi:hypothetical protein